MLTLTDSEEIQGHFNTWGQEVAWFVILFLVMLVLGGHSVNQLLLLSTHCSVWSHSFKGYVL